MICETAYPGPGGLVISGAFSNVRLKEHAGTTPDEPSPLTPTTTNHVIQTDQAFDCVFSWTASGTLHDIFAGLTPAQFKCTTYFESIGGGPEFHVASTPVNFAGPGPTSYSNTISIVAGTLTPGMYRVVSTITCEAPGVGGAMFPLPVAGYDEGLLIQVFQAP